MKDKKILIAGGAGFIGSNLTHMLVGLGAKVTVIDSLENSCNGSIKNLDNIKDKIKIHNFSVFDDRTKELIKENDVLYNLIGRTGHQESIDDPLGDLKINTETSLHLLDLCRRFNDKMKIVYTATRTEYGRPKYNPVDELHPLEPTDINGINKIAGESYHKLFFDSYGIKFVSLRISNVYGPRHNLNPNGGVWAIFMKKLLNKEPIKVFGNNQKRDFIYVSDMVDALIMSLDKKSDGQIFNIGSGEGISLNYLAELMIKFYGTGKIDVQSIPDDDKKINTGDYISNIEKIKTILGWKPKTTLEEGVRKTVEFYKGDKI